MTKTNMTVLALAAVSTLHGQAFERSASLRGGGDSNNGKCTIEVVVDGAAEVEIRGDRAVLRNLEGRPPEWRRFECNGVMPANPGDFRFQGVDGRGRQTLSRDPRSNRGAAVVLIEDRDNGSEGYTFDIQWSGSGGGFNPADRGGFGGGNDRGAYDRGGYDRGGYDRGGRGDNRFARLFDRIRDDLGAARNSMRGRGDDYRLDRVFEQLNELQRDYSRGRMNREQLDDVMGTLRRVVRDNRLSRRDRESLADDLDRLRELREQR
jgi:hypothetical protein